MTARGNPWARGRPKDRWKAMTVTRGDVEFRYQMLLGRLADRLEGSVPEGLSPLSILAQKHLPREVLDNTWDYAWEIEARKSGLFFTQPKPTNPFKRINNNG